MRKKKSLIYLDILGFDELAKEIAGKIRVTPEKVRSDFLEVITKKVETLETKREIIGKKYGESDDWLLVVDSLDKVYACITEILDHETGYLDYKKIPLEIAVGTADFGNQANLQGVSLVIQDATIEFLKTHIINHYHKWYSQRHHGQSIKSTFIVLTESAYHELEPLDRRMCEHIEYKANGKDVAFCAADPDEVIRRGKVFDFLKKIGYPGSRWYSRINQVYVPPSDHEDMVRALRERRILFLIGTQEYGKTYTACRLLWDYYSAGYEPRWIKGGESAERIEARERLENITEELKPGYIVYFEDPFGKTKYERRESLEREIGAIIDGVRQVKDVFVIITSREEVFKEFNGNNSLCSWHRVTLFRVSKGTKSLGRPQG